jgi:hypothetical protein
LVYVKTDIFKGLPITIIYFGEVFDFQHDELPPFMRSGVNDEEMGYLIKMNNV